MKPCSKSLLFRRLELGLMAHWFQCPAALSGCPSFFLLIPACPHLTLESVSGSTVAKNVFVPVSKWQPAQIIRRRGVWKQCATLAWQGPAVAASM